MQLKEFNDKLLVCVSKEDLELEETDKEKKVREEDAMQFNKLCMIVKDALGDMVEKVVSNRISNLPCLVISGQFGWSPNIEYIMKKISVTNQCRRMCYQGAQSESSRR